MNRPNPTMTQAEILDLYFLENRARLLEIASFLDRLDRAVGGKEEYRRQAFNRAVELLCKPGAGRTGAIQLSFSDPTSDPIASAVGLRATGAWGGGGREGN